MRVVVVSASVNVVEVQQQLKTLGKKNFDNAV